MIPVKKNPGSDSARAATSLSLALNVQLVARTGSANVGKAVPTLPLPDHLRLNCAIFPQQSRRRDGSHATTVPRTCCGSGGGASLAYEAMTGLGLLAAPSQASFDLTGRVSGVRVVIVGAGLTGMTVAYELGKVGYDCRVLEGAFESAREVAAAIHTRAPTRS